MSLFRSSRSTRPGAEVNNHVWTTRQSRLERVQHCRERRTRTQCCDQIVTIEPEIQRSLHPPQRWLIEDVAGVGIDRHNLSNAASMPSSNGKLPVVVRTRARRLRENVSRHDDRAAGLRRWRRGLLHRSRARYP